MDEITTITYDKAYFSTTNCSLGGYPLSRWYRNETSIPWCTGEYFKDRAKKLFDTYNLAGKKVLDIGCAFGYSVLDLREMGVEAYGIDLSEYAVKLSDSSYVTLADARSKINDYSENEFDLIIMCELLQCLPEDDLNNFARIVLEKGKQIFIIERRDFSLEATDLYNSKEIEGWKVLFPDAEIIYREEEDKWLRSK